MKTEIRERIEKYGVQSIITDEALSLLLGVSMEQMKGANLSYLFNNYRNKERFKLTKLQISKIKALEKIVTEIGTDEDIKVKITSANAIANIMMTELGHKKQEEFFVISLDTKNKIIDKKRISKGSLNASIVHPREVFKEAILNSANAIILCHNHPSGDPNPSREDIDITKRLIKAGDLIGICVLDHIIVGSNKYISFKEERLI